MALDLADVKTRASRVYAGFTPGQRTVTVLAIVGLAFGGMMFAKWASTPTLVPLFTNVTTEDAAGITEALTTEGVAYELADGGTSILVPQADVYDLRVSLSAEGLPAGDTVGYALLDEQGITTSEFDQRVGYQRALEGELKKTIESIEGVEAATVHVVIPEEDLFSDDNKRPTASVLVKTAPDTTLNGQQVQAVTNLVASSVEGLVPTEVTLADDKGNVLSAPGEDGNAMLAGDTRSQQTRAFEKEMAADVEQMLTQVVGPGGASVQVRAELDFDQQKTIRENYGKRGVATMRSNTNERYTGAAAAGAGGVLGPDGMPTTVTDPGTDYRKGDKSAEFVVDKQVSEITKAPGAVERLSVAVLLDDSAPADFGTGEIENLVAAATGFNQRRGDTIEISRLAFDRSADTAAQEELERAAAEEKSAQMMGIVRTAVVVFVILLVLALAYFSMRRATKTKATPVDVTRLESLLAAKENEEQRQLQMLTELPEIERPNQIELPPEVAERVAVHEEIVELIDNQPDEVAQLLRGWLADRRS
jgi:flagellar M-ring protein FliF